jgi:hypothetical protein
MTIVAMKRKSIEFALLVAEVNSNTALDVDHKARVKMLEI